MRKTRIKITDDFRDQYHPVNALVTYQHMLAKTNNVEEDKHARYVQSFDFDRSGHPINAHPLTTKEAISLSKVLYEANAEKTAFLKPTGLLPKNVLYINPSPDSGYVIWHTKATKRNLFFADKLGIPNGKATVPALIWRASKKGLTLFAVDSNRKPTGQTAMFQAPFFNVYDTGSVCMGSVNVAIKHSMSLEVFIAAWESYFFDSYFSHTIRESPVDGNVVLFWKEMISTQKPFPVDMLKKTPYIVKQLIK